MIDNDGGGKKKKRNNNNNNNIRRLEFITVSIFTLLAILTRFYRIKQPAA